MNRRTAAYALAGIAALVIVALPFAIVVRDRALPNPLNIPGANEVNAPEDWNEIYQSLDKCAGTRRSTDPTMLRWVYTDSIPTRFADPSEDSEISFGMGGLYRRDLHMIVLLRDIADLPPYVAARPDFTRPRRIWIAHELMHSRLLAGASRGHSPMFFSTSCGTTGP